ncbi:hypothetical protein [Pseudomonas chlororaphis]|uniref:Uncharacterized protein n=1 Tax=Pseudomonas chlororaphis O6 TaxID=1037915 RepID=A0AB33WUN9_9PSED|nr:hypothetical protein [Pseudomonas chlororaphis]EIM16874.1 hypothetical protein PchlO6_3681 [Pseudomonas chlororaphis O6]
MDAEKIINLPRHHKKTFVALLVSIYTISLLVAHYQLGQPFSDVLLDQVKSIASALITALFGLLIIIPFIPSKEKGEIIEIPAQEITAEFEKLLDSATRWRYQGNFGRYLRGKVLPTLAPKTNVQVLVCLIDPANQDLCARHAEYRGNINAIDKGKKYDSAAVSLEVMVTIVIAAWYARNKGMDISIFLSGKFDPIRIDGSDEAMILTVEDRRSPALMITQKHFTANHFNLQMQTARDQARKINLGGMRHGIQLAEIDSNDVASVLATAGLGDICKQITAQAITIACKTSKNPYEN